ncbi:DUF5803 family protein [Halalkalirubrum salinum]|uniref:DUF5803 family protein n=1 Tax=Halalkalirubrum salinum TaxID=2563889 RepID=UPI0010BFC5AF|nr:DUF5803 family protein [Halalkalirubrum salinum]
MSPNRRLVLATLVVALLAVSAGCLGWATGGGEVSREAIDREPAEPYNWDTDRDAHITVQGSSFQAVYQVNASDELRLYRPEEWGTEGPLDISAVRYRYENGTVLNGTEIEAHGGEFEQTTDEVFVTVPDSDGQLGITASAVPRRFSIPAYVEGSYEVVLPEGHSLDFFLFSNVVPRNYEQEEIDGQLHLYWEDVSGGSITVQSYRERDLLIFGGAVVLLTAIAIVGLSYYRRKIDELHDIRVSMGLKVNEDDEEDDEDDERDPPYR